MGDFEGESRILDDIRPDDPKGGWQLATSDVERISQSGQSWRHENSLHCGGGPGPEVGPEGGTGAREDTATVRWWNALLPEVVLRALLVMIPAPERSRDG